MENTFIIGPSMKKWLRLKSLLLSHNTNDLATANELIESLNLSEKAKNIIVDYLNANYPEWYFYIESSQIKRVGATEKPSNKNILLKIFIKR